MVYTSRPGYGRGVIVALLVLAIVAALGASLFAGVRIVSALTADQAGPASAEERIIEDALLAIQQDPNNVQARWQLSLALSTVGDYQQAKTEAEQAVEIDPQSVEGFYALGVAYRGLDDAERAEKALVKAGSIPGSIGDVYREIFFELGEVRMAAERYDEAVAAFEGALANGPEATYVVVALADAYLKAGDTDRAKEEYLAVLGYDNNNDTALAALRQLGATDAEIEAARDVDGHRTP